MLKIVRACVCGGVRCVGAVERFSLALPRAFMLPQLVVMRFGSLSATERVLALCVCACAMLTGCGACMGAHKNRKINWSQQQKVNFYLKSVTKCILQMVHRPEKVSTRREAVAGEAKRSELMAPTNFPP